MKILSLILLILPIGISPVFGQLATSAKNDSISIPVDSSKFYYFSENGFSYGNRGNSLKITNKLNDFQEYQLRQAGSGNPGGPERQLQFDFPPNIGFNRGKNNFSSFGFGVENRRFYNSISPFTKIQFILGQKEEMNVSVIHAHPFGKNCNVAFGFNRIRSTGFYQRQNTNNTSGNLNGWYKSPGKRYSMLADAYWTSIDVAENGGIANDSDFEFASQLDRHLVEVKLSSAETRQRMRGVWAKQYFSFGNVIDTISEESDSIQIATKIQPSWAIVHSVQLLDEKYIYSDLNPVSGFYSTIFLDSTQTKDSTFLWKLENGIWLERFDLGVSNTSRILSGKIGIKQELGEISTDTIYQHFSNYILDGGIRFNLLKKWCDNITGKGSFVLTGTNKGDYLFSAKLWSQGFSENKLFGFVSVQSSLVHPAFIFSNFAGNNFRWKNDFYQTGISNLNVGLYWIGIKQSLNLTAGYFDYSDPVYFGQDKLPLQNDGTISAFVVNLNWLAGSKSLKVKSDFSWNKIDSNSPLRLPELIIRESIYGDFLLFKKALQLQIGLDGTWFSAYYADGYNPNNAQFYLQDSKKLGNYMFLSPWVSIKVKPVRIFVKADHVNAGMMGRNYYLIPHYPQNDFALKFGLSWVFND